MQEHISRMVGMMALDNGAFTHNRIYLFFKIVNEFRGYILTIDKPAGSSMYFSDML